MLYFLRRNWQCFSLAFFQCTTCKRYLHCGGLTQDHQSCECVFTPQYTIRTPIVSRKIIFEQLCQELRSATYCCDLGLRWTIRATALRLFHFGPKKNNQAMIDHMIDTYEWPFHDENYDIQS